MINSEFLMFFSDGFVIFSQSVKLFAQATLTVDRQSMLMLFDDFLFVINEINLSTKRILMLMQSRLNFF